MIIYQHDHSEAIVCPSLTRHPAKINQFRQVQDESQNISYSLEPPVNKSDKYNRKENNCVFSSLLLNGSKVCPMDISPLPQLNEKNFQINKRGRRSCSATVLSSIPYEAKFSGDLSKK